MMAAPTKTFPKPDSSEPTKRIENAKMDTATVNPAPATVATTTTTTTTSKVKTRRVRAIDVIRGEWIKFWSIRSTSMTLMAAALVTVAFGMIFSAVAESGTATGPAAFLTDPVDVALGGVGLAEMIVGVVGVLFVAGEYSTGLIRTAFAAVGRRGRIIRAKAAVVSVSVFTAALAAVTGAIVAGQAVYAGSGETVPVTDVLDVVFGTSVYLTGIALIGVAFGFIFRSTAAGIGTLVGGVFIGPNLLNLLPDSITDVFLKYLPSEVGAAMTSRIADPDLLSTGSAYAVFGAWVVGLLALAGVLVHRRDA